MPTDASPPARDPSTFPLMLAGPVLRKVTAAAVNVWVATCQPCTVTLNVYSGQAAANLQSTQTVANVPGTVIGTGSRHTVPVGAQLHIAVVTADNVGAPPDTLCSYDVMLDVDAGSSDAVSQSGKWNLGGLSFSTAVTRPTTTRAGSGSPRAGCPAS